MEPFLGYRWPRQEPEESDAERASTHVFQTVLTLQLEVHVTTHKFHVGSREPNSGPHNCAADFRML